MLRIVFALFIALLPILGMGALVEATEVDGSDPRDTDLVYLEIRADLDETNIIGHGVPTQVHIEDVFSGYSLPVWSDPANLNEELYFSVCVPDRYDEEHDIVIEIISALSDAGEFGNAYQLDIAWEKATPNIEVVPAGFHSVSAQRYILSNLQYYCYKDYFVVDYDANAIDPIINDDEFNFRLRLGQVGGQYTDLDGELIILHVGILFSRGDLLGEEDNMAVGIILIALAILALGLTVAMFATRQSMLGFPCVIFWAILGGYAYTESTTAWGDWQYYLAFGSLFGMTAFCALAAFGLREKRDTVADVSMDEEVGEEEEYIDEGGSGDGFGESKGSKRTRELRQRAKDRRTK